MQQTETDYTSYDSYDNPTTIISKKGNTAILRQNIRYNSNSVLINQNLILPELTQVTDLSNNLVRSIYTTYTDQGKQQNSYEGSDTNGVRLSTLAYDNQGRVISQRIPNKNGSGSDIETTYTYQETPTQLTVLETCNNKTTTKIYEKNTGKLIQTRDENNNQTQIQYDSLGRTTTITYPDNSQTNINYSSDLKITTTTQGGKTTRETIDSIGRVILVEHPGEEDLKYDYWYGTLQKAVSKRQNTPPGSWVTKKTTTYDAYMRKVTNSSPDWGTTTIQYDTPQMNATTITDPISRRIITYQNELGQTTQTTNPDNTSIQTTYNNFGEALQTIDPRGLIHKVDRDTYGHITKTYRTHKTNPTLSKTETTYLANVSGVPQETRTYAANGSLLHTYTSVYDNEGRVIQTKQDGQIKDVLTYDESDRSNGKGQLTTAETPDTITKYDYDNMGRILAKTTTIKAINKTFAIRYGYTSTGKVGSIAYPDGKQIQYSYDGLQRIQKIQYDNQTIANYAYNPNGTLSTMTYGNNTQFNYSYSKKTI